MKAKYGIIAFLIMIGGMLGAQNNPSGPNVDQMHEQKWQYMVEQTKLPTSKVDMIHPIFLEYEKSTWKQHEKSRKFFMNAKNTNTKPNYQELNDLYVDTELIQAQLLRSYHFKLRKILDSETLFKYYKAERDFKRKLLKDFNGNGRNRDK